MSLLISILQLCLAILTLPLHILSFLGIWSVISRKIFPYILAPLMKSYNNVMDATKKDLFSNLGDFAGNSKEIKLLEIGCGTGANFKFYPNNCRVTCLDINPNFEKFLVKSQAENSHLKFEGSLVASADNMKQVADASQDVVVCTLVVCSVPNTPKVLEEVWRVLKPGGAFFFLEHVACSDEATWLCFFQRILNPTWKLVFDGCNLRKFTWKDLENAKFSTLKLRHIQARTMIKPVTPHIVGYAVK
ncbi:methyltransferase like 7A [Xenopus tropicalis]|uniref:Methyltransferase like 7A n=1 Tax=Xenopus tropicalis TaxID=8364 RepID=Q0VFQ8_XENTR|eukprot:NP_001072195.1 methyltransferase like 7A [Xenopus tropicalis]